MGGYRADHTELCRDERLRYSRYTLYSVSVFQLTIAMLDWMLASLVLFVLLSAGPAIPFPAFLAAYLLAQLAGLVSQVPGGLGVFETMIVLILSPRLPADHIAGALLGYRALYYCLPLVIAALLLGLQEILRKRKRLVVFAGLFERWVSPMIPQVLALTAFVCGAILLFSGNTPVVAQRIVILKKPAAALR